VAARAFATTNTASAAAMLAWMFFDGLRGRHPSATGACIGDVVGLVGMVLTGVPARDVGLLAGRTSTFAHHIAALVIVSTFSSAVSYMLFRINDMLVSVRVSAEDEIVGLDISQHAERMMLAVVPRPAGAHAAAAGVAGAPGSATRAGLDDERESAPVPAAVGSSRSAST
jgi:Amt family ammonium transporter